MTGILSIIGISVLPFLYLFTQQQIVGNFSYAFGNIAGFIGATFLFWEFVLGIKDLAKKFPINTTQFMKLHIFLGVWGIFFVLVHPILEIMVYDGFIIEAFLGWIAFFLVVLVWLTSSFLRNHLSYKRWLNIHYLSYPMMFFVFIHALDMGSFLHAFIGIKIYWFVLLASYVGLCIWRASIAIKNKI